MYVCIVCTYLLQKQKSTKKIRKKKKRENEKGKNEKLTKRLTRIEIRGENCHRKTRSVAIVFGLYKYILLNDMRNS